MPTKVERLLPGGIPRWIRVYDDGKSGDRYTVVFTKNARMYIGMGASPFHPQGICQHGDWRKGDRPIDRPRSAHLGKKIKFQDLPLDCQKVVLRDYCEIYELPYVVPAKPEREPRGGSPGPFGAPMAGASRS